MGGGTISGLALAGIAALHFAACSVPEREFIPDEVFYGLDATTPDSGTTCSQPRCVGCRNCFSRCICLGGSVDDCVTVCATGLNDVSDESR